MKKEFKEKFAGETFIFNTKDVFCESDNAEAYKLIILADNCRIEKDCKKEDETIEFTASETSNLKANKYDIYLLAEKDNQKQIRAIGTINVKNNIFFTNEEYNNSLSHAQKMVKLIEQALENRITDEYVSLSFNGKSVTKYTPAELLNLLKYYKGLIAKQEYKKLNNEDKSKLSVVYLNY